MTVGEPTVNTTAAVLPGFKLLLAKVFKKNEEA